MARRLLQNVGLVATAGLAMPCVAFTWASRVFRLNSVVKAPFPVFWGVQKT